MAVPRVYFVPGDEMNRGIDEDRRLTEIALHDLVTITDVIRTNTAGVYWMANRR